MTAKCLTHTLAGIEGIRTLGLLLTRQALCPTKPRRQYKKLETNSEQNATINTHLGQLSGKTNL